MLRDYVGPFALQTMYEEMEKSMFYETLMMQLPTGSSSWVSTSVSTNSFIFWWWYGKDEYAIAVADEPGFQWEENEENVSFYD